MSQEGASMERGLELCSLEAGVHHEVARAGLEGPVVPARTSGHLAQVAMATPKGRQEKRPSCFLFFKE